METDDGPAEARYDVAVVGGGVNGTGVARDLSLRGLSVVLYERHDLAFGASGNSSGMIHGGPRYLLHTPGVTKSSCLDSGYIQRIAPHLLFRIPFLVPMKAGLKGRVMLELYDAFFRAYDDFQPLKRGELHTRLDASELSRLEPGLVGSILGGVTFDEWGVDGARLSVMCTRPSRASRRRRPTIRAIARRATRSPRARPRPADRPASTRAPS
jgi:glycerol-3-phosphate dehydrogenase